MQVAPEGELESTETPSSTGEVVFAFFGALLGGGTVVGQAVRDQATEAALLCVNAMVKSLVKGTQTMRIDGTKNLVPPCHA